MLPVTEEQIRQFKNLCIIIVMLILLIGCETSKTNEQKVTDCLVAMAKIYQAYKDSDFEREREVLKKRNPTELEKAMLIVWATTEGQIASLCGATEWEERLATTAKESTQLKSKF
ncbi:MAG: hypothetical protein OXC68_13165 [Aestuariivita sp.]|nr:hypothetical protein [Aestuariivita sp.]